MISLNNTIEPRMMQHKDCIICGETFYRKAGHSKKTHHCPTCTCGHEHEEKNEVYTEYLPDFNFN